MEVMLKLFGDEKFVNFYFDIIKQSGNEVLCVQDFIISYENQLLFLIEVLFMFIRGESVVFVGFNGIGKLILLKILMDILKLD